MARARRRVEGVVRGRFEVAQVWHWSGVAALVRAEATAGVYAEIWSDVGGYRVGVDGRYAPGRAGGFAEAVDVACWKLAAPARLGKVGQAEIEAEEERWFEAGGDGGSREGGRRERSSGPAGRAPAGDSGSGDTKGGGARREAGKAEGPVGGAERAAH